MSETYGQRLIQDPAFFASHVLGVSFWHKQNEIAKSITVSDRVCVKSGHKIGKSLLAACLALWFAWTHDNARVIMTSASARQVKSILWREVQTRFRSAKIKLEGVCHDDPNSGIKLSDGSEIVGFSTDEPERMAGISGANLFFIIDEASGVPEPIFEAIEGNRAGGAKLLMLSNPTKTYGTFYDAFNDPIKKELWKPFSISSEETPTARGLANIPGLATRAWIDEKRIEWGPDYLRSPIYRVRVLGEFPIFGDNNVISYDLCHRALEEYPSTLAVGALTAGLDPAGSGSDDSALSVVRGLKQIHIQTWNKLDGFELAGVVVRALDDLRIGEEKVTLNVDSIGVGAAVYQCLCKMAVPWLQVHSVKASERSNRPDTYALLRDELWFGIANWLKAGGVLLPDSKQETELLAVEFAPDSKGKIKVDSKDVIKKKISRSPDRADALSLALYNGTNIMQVWNQHKSILKQRLQRKQQRATV